MDAIIIGGGPAGCSAASWLSQLGLRAALVERSTQLCATLGDLHFEQDWLLGAPGKTLAELGAGYAAHTLAVSSLQLLLGTSMTQVGYQPESGWEVQTRAGTHLAARTLLVATGQRPLRPPQFCEPASDRVFDAIGLTGARASLPPSHILLLGGGDNAAENALYLHARGHQVTLWSRSSLRAQGQFVRRLHALGRERLTLRLGTPLPLTLRTEAGGSVQALSAEFGAERFDHAAVLLGYEPEPSAWTLVAQAIAAAGLAPPALPLRDEARWAALGLFVAGDASSRLPASVQTALADGVIAARAIEQQLRPASAQAGKSAKAIDADVARNNRQVIHLQGLRFGANLGVLDFERVGPQPIQIDAELNLGAQAIVARDADIGRVLDYRRVRSIIMDECTAEHTDLVEALLAKLSHRLMQLPGVVGVRLKLTKLEIFPDCQVAISAESGAW